MNLLVSLCFGIAFPSNTWFPWTGEDSFVSHQDDVDEWWEKVNGFTPVSKIFDEDGNYIDGKIPTTEEMSVFWEEVDKWHRENPLPIEVLEYNDHWNKGYILCSPISIEAFPSTYAYPLAKTTYAYDPILANQILDFCKKYGIETNSRPSWLISISS